MNFSSLHGQANPPREIDSGASPRCLFVRGADNAEFLGEYYDEDDGEFKAEYAMFGKATRRAAPAPTPAR